MWTADVDFTIATNLAGRIVSCRRCKHRAVRDDWKVPLAICTHPAVLAAHKLTKHPNDPEGLPIGIACNIARQFSCGPLGNHHEALPEPAPKAPPVRRGPR